jgi:hypothetical protein
LKRRNRAGARGFRQYQAMTRKVAGGEVTVTPIEMIDATA